MSSNFINIHVISFLICSPLLAVVRSRRVIKSLIKDSHFVAYLWEIFKPSQKIDGAPVRSNNL